ncbi:MAG: PAS domain-containing sensor histidine kinase [Saprospiraceae bacterium]
MKQRIQDFSNWLKNQSSDTPIEKPTIGSVAWVARWQNHALIGLALAVLLGVLSLNYIYSEGANLRSYATDIEATLHGHEEEIEIVSRDSAFLRRQVYGLNKLSSEDQKNDADRILALSQRPYNLCVYEKDSLLLWTNNRVFLPESFTPSRLPALQLRRHKNGYYIIKHSEVELFAGRSFDIVSLVPIKNAYTLNSEHLNNTFTENKNIPYAVDLCQVPTAFPVRASTGEVVSYLHNTRKFKDWRYQALLLGLYFLGFGIIGILLNNLAVGVEKRYGTWAGGITIVSGVIATRSLMVASHWSDQFNDLGMFSKMFQTPVLSGSLGGLLLNVLVVLWLVTFFHRHYSLPDQSKSSELKRYAITGGHYLAIILSSFALTHAFQKVVTNSDLRFNFKNIIELDSYSMLAVLAMLILIFGTFLFSHRLMLGITEIGLSKRGRAMSLFGAMGLALPIMLSVGCPLPIPHFYLGAVVFVLVYDMFIDSGEANVLWLFFWLVVLAMYSAALLFTFNEQKDLTKRINYAQVLSEPRDTTAEAGLKVFISSLRSDIKLQEILAEEKQIVSMRNIQPPLERMLVDQGYLYNNYQDRVWGYDASNDSTFLQGRTAIEAKRAVIRFAEANKIDDNLRYELLDGKRLVYLIHINSELVRGATRSLYMEFEHSQRAASRVFTELFEEERYRHLPQLDAYDYAVYRQGELVEQSGGTHPQTLRLPNLPQPGNHVSATNSQYSNVLYAGLNETYVLIGKDMGGYLRPMSLFSYLFVWCIILTLGMSFINTYVNVLPTAIDITWLGKPNLKTKIQVGIVTLVLLSFGMIGYVTKLYFHNSTDAYHDNRLNRKVASILRNTEHEILLLSELTEVDRPSLERILKPISEIHRMDINLYDLDGDLMSSSEPDIFKRGVIAPKMGAFAYQMLAKGGLSQAVQRESVGDLSYRTAYVPVRMPEGATIAYMGLPYYTKERDLRDDVSSFMGTLLNVYVFLLLIAGVIAITVANSITKPLSELGAKIRRFKLDEKVEPLVWEAKDELGDLIGAFNTMLSTVESSAKELDNARREKAWREMAQQVAHEIKNPLTPMKLSIQYLRHALGRDPEEVEGLIKRVSHTLIEQIDNLATIATTFSTFARMPEPENTHFELNTLVQSVHDLFLEEDVDSTLHIAQPEEGKSYDILADKKLLMRVLNNLIKNAIQAIPEERRGRISVNLHHQDELALIEVTDNGTGIPEEMQEKVFFPKFTTKSSGTGLGLAICRDIVKAAGGRIWFETKEDVGTQFYVELPLAKKIQETPELSDQNS